MARTLLLFLILLAASAGACWWLLSPATARWLRPEADSMTARHDVAAVGGATADQATTGTSTTAPDFERASAPAQHGDAPPEIPPDAVWTTVTIVDEADAPVADAEVDWVFGIDERFGDGFGEEHVEAHAAEHGRHSRSDAAGRVRIVTGNSAAWVYARKDGRWGHEGIWAGRTPPPGGFRLVLRRDVTLAVLVKDAEGRPAAGVPLLLLMREQRSAELAWAMQSQRTTGDDGLAIWPHAQTEARFAWGAQAGKQVPWWEITVPAPDLEVDSLWIQPHDPPAEPPVLQLPPTGHLRVVATVAGRPEPGSQRMWLAASPHREQRGLQSLALDPGIGEFRHLPLGKRFRVGRGNWQFDIDGPTAAGEWHEVRIDLTQRMQTLAGRLLDEDGRPSGGVTFWAQWQLDGAPGSGRLNTDADGRFVATLGEASAADAPSKLEKFQLRSLDRDLLRGELPAQTLSRGMHEIGDLRLQRLPLVASGRITVDCDRPPSPRLEVQFFDANHQSPWSTAPNCSAEVQDDRTFEVRGEPPAAPLRLLVHARDLLSPEPVEFRSGARDLVIPLQCGHALSARCTPPAGLVPNQLYASLRVEGSPWQPVAQTWPPNPLLAGCWPHDGGRYEIAWPALPGGTYTLSVGLRSLDGPVLELHDVVVPPPPDGDPRLADLDLRQVVSTIQLTLDIEPDRDGKVRPDVMVFVLPQASNDEWVGTMLWERQGSLPVAPGPHDLLVTMSGRRPVELHAVQGSATVALRRWPELDLQFIGADTLPAGVKLLVSIDRPTPATTRSITGNGHLGTVEEAIAPPNRPVEVTGGRATVMLDEGTERLRVEVVFGERRRALQQIAPREVMAGSPVTVQLSADEVAQAVAALDRE